MNQAARAIIIENNKLLVMYRKKGAAEYYTLVGGKLNENETPEQALIREVKEETDMTVTSQRLVFTETHPEPYNNQFIYLCEVAPHDEVNIRHDTEEGLMNRIDINIHKPMWVDMKHFAQLPFSTMQLQKVIVESLNKGFPKEVVHL
jgi:8-oxo-dGTP diphosphatase